MQKRYWITIIAANICTMLLRCHPNGTDLPFSFQDPYQECLIRFLKFNSRGLNSWDAPPFFPLYPFSNSNCV
jgi:hypothetical protein